MTETLARSMRLPDLLVAAAAAAGIPPKRLHELTVSGDRHALAEEAPGLHPSKAPAFPDNGFVLVLGEPNYPQQLAQAPNPPRILYGRGNAALLHDSGVAVAGTRTPTALGTTVAASAASAAALAGAPVITGGAAGVDHTATSSALQYGARVVLVLATGPDRNTGSEQADLVTEVLAHSGVVVSEHPFGTGTDTAPGYQPAAYRSRLVARNRIIAGLSSLLIPASGSLPSGTAGAVWAAVAAGRPVVVARPKPHAAQWPDAHLVAALSHPHVPTVGQLRNLGAPKQVAEKIVEQGTAVNAVVETPEELEQATAVLWGLSPHRPARS